MLKDIELIMEFLKSISTIIHGKETIFYDKEKNKWYSRTYCDYLDLEELLDILKDDIYEQFYKDDYDEIGC